jgi:CheY-like chemotaxis protein
MGKFFPVAARLGVRLGSPRSVRVVKVSVPTLPDLNGLHVLVVDDNEDTREILQSFFTHLGAVVTIATNGSEGLAALKELRAHVIVSDLSMPGIDGYEFMRCVRALPGEAQHPTPAIAITGFVQREDRERALRSGYQSFIAKPADPLFVAQEVARLGRQPPTEKRRRAS